MNKLKMTKKLKWIRIVVLILLSLTVIFFIGSWLDGIDKLDFLTGDKYTDFYYDFLILGIFVAGIGIAIVELSEKIWPIILILILALSLVAFSFHVKPDFKAMEESLGPERNFAGTGDGVDEELLYEYKNSESFYLIYFSRDSCLECVKFKERLSKFSTEEDVSVWVYETEDHEGDKEYKTVLDEFGVTDIPSIRVIGEGKIIKDIPLTQEGLMKAKKKYDL